MLFHDLPNIYQHKTKLRLHLPEVLWEFKHRSKDGASFCISAYVLCISGLVRGTWVSFCYTKVFLCSLWLCGKENFSTGYQNPKRKLDVTVLFFRDN